MSGPPVYTSEMSQKEQKTILSALDEVISSIDNLVSDIKKLNLIDNDIFYKREASKEELMNLTANINQSRKVVFNKLVKYHFLSKENTTETAWVKMISSFNKELEITAH